jgi:hypothetical protein
MKTKGKRAILILALVVLLVIAGIGFGTNLLFAGNKDRGLMGLEDARASLVTSLDEAEAMIGAKILIPAYLPPGYEIQRIFVLADHVLLLFSDGVITDAPDKAPGSPTHWQDEFERPNGAKLAIQLAKMDYLPEPDMWGEIASGRAGIPDEVVDLGAVKGLLLTPAANPVADIWYLRWWHSMFAFDLQAPVGLGRDEVIKIASSVPVLSSYFREVSLEEAENIIGTDIGKLTLPPGYKFQRAFAWGDNIVYALLSDIPVGKASTQSELSDMLSGPDQTGAKIILKMDSVVPQPPRPDIDLLQVLPGKGEVLQFDGQRAILREAPGYYDLEWYTQEAHFWMKAVKALGVDQLGEIIKSAGQ